jgi:hypothetical protein
MKFISLLKSLVFTLVLFYSFSIFAVEIKLHGVVDIRASHVDSLDSFRDSGYGKFDLNNGNKLSLAQAGAELVVEWDNGISGHLVANAYSNNEDNSVGLTESYLKYMSLPNSSGYRWQSKLGFLYPDLSLENNATAWASKNTLNFSTINTWVAEEIRVLGSELSLTRLGKFHQDSFDVSLTVAAFTNNDPAGSLLSWHGWTAGNRQTLLTEKVALPIGLPIVSEGGKLAGNQSLEADPFFEVDDQLGGYISGKIKWHGKGELSLLYYDNNATPYNISDGQYGWRTRFSHVAMRWLLPTNIEFTTQYLQGDTLMQSHQRVDVVNNDYRSAYVALSKRMKQHRITARIEEFSVTDKDDTTMDNNREYGKSLTVNYTYRVSRPWLLSIEHNWINSKRPARFYVNQPIKLVENQYQLAARYFF